MTPFTRHINKRITIGFTLGNASNFSHFRVSEVTKKWKPPFPHSVYYGDEVVCEGSQIILLPITFQSCRSIRTAQTELQPTSSALQEVPACGPYPHKYPTLLPCSSTKTMESSIHLDPMRAELYDDDDDFSDASFEHDESSQVDLEVDKKGGGEPNPIDEVKALAKSETRKMAFWKVFVVASILLTGGAVSMSVYIFLDNKQQDEFENQVR